MRDFNDRRYELETKLNTAQQGGALFQGKDLSLKRNVLIYQFTDRSDEEALQQIRNVYGFNHPRFLHILDISRGDRGLLVALESRKGGILAEVVQSTPFSFDQCLSLTLRVGKLTEVALNEGIRDFSLSMDNFWYTENDQVMAINYWSKGAPRHRGAIGLFHLLCQLLFKSTEIPADADQEQLLRKLRETRALTEDELDIVSQLFHSAFIQSSPSFSFTLLLSQLIDSRTQSDEQPTAVEHEITPPVKNRLQLLMDQTNRIKKELLTKNIRKKPLFIAASLLIIIIASPIFIFASKGERTNPLEAEEALSSTAYLETSDRDEQKDDESKDADMSIHDQDQSEKEQEIESTVDESEERTTVENEETNDEGLIVVPQLIGLSLPEAEEEALRIGLKYKYFKESSDALEGTVFEQDLEPGAVVKKWSPITFWVSRGS